MDESTIEFMWDLRESTNSIVDLLYLLKEMV